jgi:hypothetical protein
LVKILNHNLTTNLNILIILILKNMSDRVVFKF